MAGRARSFGVLGAALLLAGFALTSVGMFGAATAEQAANQCHSSCSSQFRASFNASLAESEYLGLGLGIAGVGAALILAAAYALIQSPPAASGALSGGPEPRLHPPGGST